MMSSADELACLIIANRGQIEIHGAKTNLGETKANENEHIEIYCPYQMHI